MPISTSFSVGTVAANEWLLELFPRYHKPNPGIQFVAGAGSRATYCIDEAGEQNRLTTLLVGDGYEGISGDNGPNPQGWGNATAVQRIGAQAARLATRAGTDDYILVSGSMGGLNSLVYAAQATKKPNAIISVIPVIHLGDIHAFNRGGYQPLINAAYGGQYVESTMGSTRNPWAMRSMSKLMGIPMLFFYGLTDTLCLPHLTEQFAAADAANRQIVSLPTGHEMATYESVNHEMILDFVREHS